MGLDNSIVGKIVTIGAGNGNFFEKSRYLRNQGDGSSPENVRAL